jgi:predicted NAD-dependent protein-ADP-ribosyltransferase YbiA (DUF1768 family)
MNTQNRVVAILKPEADFGGLSNLAGDYPLLLNGIRIPSTEHLYQALKFPGHPEFQRCILKAGTAADALRVATNKLLTRVVTSHAHRVDLPKYAVASRKQALKTTYDAKIRSDWDHIKLDVMYYCLRLKLITHWVRFGSLLRSTDDAEILVAATRKASFWGVFTSKNGLHQYGHNHLGRLLMKLRDELNQQDNVALRFLPSPIHLNLQLLGCELAPVDRRDYLRQSGTRFSQRAAEMRP